MSRSEFHAAVLISCDLKEHIFFRHPQSRDTVALTLGFQQLSRSVFLAAVSCDFNEHIFFQHPQSRDAVALTLSFSNCHEVYFLLQY